MVKRLMRLRIHRMSGAPKPYATLNRACTLVVRAGRREEHDVALPLMGTFCMIMDGVRCQRMPQGWFPAQDQPRQGLVPEGADPVEEYRIRHRLRLPSRNAAPIRHLA